MLRTLALVLALGFSSSPSPVRAAIWPSATKRVERELSASDPEQRLRALALLSRLPRSAAERLGLQALEDSEPRVASGALALLLELEVDGVSARVVAWLSGSERKLRLAAARALALEPAVGTLSALGRALGDSDAEVRWAAASALSASREAGASLSLLGHLDDQSPEVREAVVSALAAQGDKRAVLPLIGKIEDPRPNVRKSVARALGVLGDPRAVSALLLSLRDAERTVVAEVVRALGLLKDPSAAPALSGLLAAAPPPEVRRELLRALARTGGAEATRALLTELGFDEPGREREPVLRAISQDVETFAGALRACLRSAPSPTMAEGCALSLSTAPDEASAAAVQAALDRGQLSARVALFVLGKLGAARSLPAALERLAARDEATRTAAVDCAFALLDPRQADGRALEPIVKALSAARSSRAERLRLVELLGRTASPRALPVLVPLARNTEDEQMAEHAIRALAFIAGVESSAALLSAFDADSDEVSRAAAFALQRSADPGLVPPLLDRFERSGARRRYWALVALRGPMSGATNERDIARLVALGQSARAGERDALFEALARCPRESAQKALRELARSSDPLDRAKVAEVLTASSASDASFLLLLADGEASVRANAAWSSGFGAGPLAPLIEALRDPERAVAGNAAISLARRARALGNAQAALSALCPLLRDPRASVREQSLRALTILPGRCADGAERELLRADRRARVRRAAAELVRRAPSEDDARLLVRCWDRDPDAAVAETCAAGPDFAAARVGEAVSVVIVPPLGGEPRTSTPFALALADGSLRLGFADRRGALWEPHAPAGAVELLSYAGGD